MKCLNKIFILVFVSASILFSQYNKNNFAVEINAVYTTNARIFFYPNSSDPILRNSSFPLGGVVNPAISFRYKILNSLILGINSGYMTKTSSGYNLTAFSGDSTISVLVKDGFSMIPIELSLHYVLPFSTDDFKFMMGGGIGYYFGSQIRNIGNDKVTNIERKFSYGIQVSVGMDYLLTKNLGLHSEMKFRDPQFEVISKYLHNNVMYDGKKIRIAQNSFDSKINVYGITFILGAVFYF